MKEVKEVSQVKEEIKQEIQNEKDSILQTKIDDAQWAVDYHLNKLTDSEQRLNILKAIQDEK